VLGAESLRDDVVDVDGDSFGVGTKIPNSSALPCSASFASYRLHRGRIEHLADALVIDRRGALTKEPLARARVFWHGRSLPVVSGR
jgi:hypothetical protein